MICNYCKNDIPTGSKFCPHCGEPVSSEMRSVEQTHVNAAGAIGCLAWIVIAVVVIVVSVPIFKHLTRDDEMMFNVPEVDVIQLCLEYRDNQVAADNKYANKKIIVEGYINDIGKDSKGTYVNFYDDIFLYCYFDNSARLEKLHTGDRVKISGIVKRAYSRYSIDMRDCIMLE